MIELHSLHDVSNVNGLRLINFAASRGLFIGTTSFPGKRIHKATWTSPDGSTCNQIDHLLISDRHKSDLMSTISYRGANVDSDHYLATAKIRSRISLAKKAKSKSQNV